MSFLLKKSFLTIAYGFSKKCFFSTGLKCVPTLSKDSQKFKHLIRIVIKQFFFFIKIIKYDQDEVETLVKDTNMTVESVFVKDIKEYKLDWIYQQGRNFNVEYFSNFQGNNTYEKSLIVYDKFNYEKTIDCQNKLMKLGAKINREITSKKIKEIDIEFPKKFKTSSFYIIFTN